MAVTFGMITEAMHYRQGPLLICEILEQQMLLATLLYCITVYLIQKLSEKSRAKKDCPAMQSKTTRHFACLTFLFVGFDILPFVMFKLPQSDWLTYCVLGLIIEQPDTILLLKYCMYTTATKCCESAMTLLKLNVMLM